MKRQTRIKLRRIKYFLTNNIRRVLYFPIAVVKLILSPLYIARAVFFPKERRKHPRLDSDVYTHLKRIDRRLDWLDDKTSPTGVLPTMISHELRLNSRFKALEDRTKQLSTRINNQLELINNNDDDIRALFRKKLKAALVAGYGAGNKKAIRALEDSIKTINTRLKEAGILNDIELIVQPTDEELEAIEADAKYSSDFEVVKVNRKEYDYKDEQRAMAKQIAKRAKEDEEFDNLS